jgi:hypothetical protein
MAAQHPGRLVFRIPATALFAVAIVLGCAIPLASAARALLLVLLLPLGTAAWVLWARTTVDDRGVRVRGLTGRRALRWSEIAALRVRERGWVRCVPMTEDSDGGATRDEVLMPCVRARHLPLLAALSGGRLPDFTAAADEPAAAPTTTAAGTASAE